MSAQFTPKTIVDLERMTRADIIALYIHCMRMGRKDEHIRKDQTEDNEWLIGDDTNFLIVVDDYIKKTGAKIDSRNVKPVTGLVLQASPEYYRPEYDRDDPDGFGKYDQKKTDAWVAANVKWLKETFGSDCVAAHLHVDERTVHIHAIIVPTFEKAPTMPKNKRKNETQENFDRRVERAKRKKGKKVVSHHKHHLFGAGRKSYGKVVDSYAAAVEHLGIERSERGSEATPTTKQEWVRQIYKKTKEAELNVISMQKRQKLEDESFEFGSAAVIDEKIKYRDADDIGPERLVKGANWPAEKAEQEEITEKVKPAKYRIVAFAKMVKEFTNSSLEKAKVKIFQMLKAVQKREAAAEAKKAEIVEREKALSIIEAIEETSIDDGEMSDKDDKILRNEGVIQDEIKREPVLKVRTEIIRTQVR